MFTMKMMIEDNQIKACMGNSFDIVIFRRSSKKRMTILIMKKEKEKKICITGSDI